MYQHLYQSERPERVALQARALQSLELLHSTQAQRGFGDVYGFMLVARGAADLMLEYGVHAWDVAAVLPIIEEAGGTFTNYDGGQDIHKPDVVVSNGVLHEEALRIIHAHELRG